MKFSSFSSSFLFLSFMKEKYRLYSSGYVADVTFRMQSKNLITKKIPNERRGGSIGFRFKVQRKSSETSKEKNKDRRKKIPMIRLAARRKIQIWLFGIGLRFIHVPVFAD